MRERERRTSPQTRIEKIDSLFQPAFFQLSRGVHSPAERGHDTLDAIQYYCRIRANWKLRQRPEPGDVGPLSTQDSALSWLDDR
jgi:hypothetical protein